MVSLLAVFAIVGAICALFVHILVDQLIADYKTELKRVTSELNYATAIMTVDQNRKLSQFKITRGN